MSERSPLPNPERREVLDDNARKFVTDPLDPVFLTGHGAISYILVTDWLETNEDNEKKLAFKQFDDGNIQRLKISKVTEGDNRTSQKEKLAEEAYREQVAGSLLHVEKRRYEFTYVQARLTFAIKYDEFTDSDLRLLEVDAPNEAQRALFRPEEFASKLSEVTCDTRYYGYRIGHMV